MTQCSSCFNLSRFKAVYGVFGVRGFTGAAPLLDVELSVSATRDSVSC